VTEPYFNFSSVQEAMNEIFFEEYQFKSVLRCNRKYKFSMFYSVQWYCRVSYLHQGDCNLGLNFNTFASYWISEWICICKYFWFDRVSMWRYM